MALSYRDRLYNYYTVEVRPKDIRFVYVFEIHQGKEIYYYSEDGLSDHYDFTLNYYNAFQIAYINESDLHKPVSWMADACFYQIFVDRFFRGDDAKDDSYINLPWGEIPNPKSFAGGDLKGIQKKLPYLQDLGINALYLTPILSPSAITNMTFRTISLWMPCSAATPILPDWLPMPIPEKSVW